MRIVFGWPPSGLSPNSRLHWAKKSKLAKVYRHACWGLAREALGTQKVAARGRFALRIEFVPPDRRHRDDDNMIGAFKAGRDGLADALGLDDSLFDVTYRVDRSRVGGMVIVEVGNG
jgi:crossover junction endodeoxyribonuclease RusA